MRLAVVLVHYRAAALAAEAIARVRADPSGAGLVDEIVVVDNGSNEDDRCLLASTGVTVLHPGENLGYAGGANLGIAATTAEAIVLMNPDVLVEAGCLGELAGELARDAGVAGPRLFWDRGRRMLLPPAERQGRRAEIARLLAHQGPAFARRSRRAHRVHARRHWSSRAPIQSFALSGAILALRRDAWERIGPFDEGYQLYFEETDWLERARRGGLVSRHVPAAVAIHLFNRSARDEPRSAAWYQASERRFRERHLGRFFCRALDRAGRWRSPATPGSTPPAARLPDGRVRRPPQLAGRAWVELSPTSTGVPAAGELLPTDWESWQPPAGVLESIPGQVWNLWLVDEHGHELASGTWTA